MSKGTSRSVRLNRWVYSLKVSRSCCFIEKRLRRVLWQCLLLEKWCRNRTLNSWNEPAKVIRNTQHFTSLLYWYNKKAFSKWQRLSSGSEIPMYSPIYRGRKWLDITCVRISLEKGVSLLVATIFFDLNISSRSLLGSFDRRWTLMDCFSCGVDIPLSNSSNEGIGTRCYQRSFSTVVATILLKLFTVQATRAPNSKRMLWLWPSNVDPSSSWLFLYLSSQHLSSMFP